MYPPTQYTGIQHAASCTAPKSEKHLDVVLWSTEMGTMRRLVYYCATCGESYETQRFEPAPEEE